MKRRPRRARKAAPAATPEPTYTASIVAAAAGIPEITLRKWRERGHVDVASADGWARFTFLELLRVAARGELLRLGLPISNQAARLLKVLDLDLEAIADGRQHANQASYALVTLFDNETVTVQSMLSAEQLQARLVQDLKRHGVAIAVNASSIARRILQYLTTNGYPLPTSIKARW